MKITGNPKSATPWQRFRSDVFSCLKLLVLVIAVTGCTAEARKTRLLDRANGFFDAGEYDKAKIEYMNVLQKDAKNVVALQRLGIIWSEQGAPLRAFPFLKNALELAPDNLPVRTKLALAYMDLGSPKEARQEAVAILDRAPSHAEAIILLADTAFSEDDVSFTEEQLLKLKDPDRAAIHVAAAGLAARRGDLATLEKEAQAAMVLDPKSTLAHLTMANSFLAKKDYVKAGEAFKTAANLAPLRSSARLKLAEFKLATGAAAEAAVLLQELTRKVPDYLPAWQIQAQMAFAEKKYDDSFALLDKVLTRDPSNIEARMLQAQAYLAKGETKKAVTVLESLHTSFPKLPRPAYQLTLAYLQDANPTQARVVLEQLVATNPDHADAVLLLARVNLGAGNAQAVVTLMQGLLKTHATLVPAQLLLAEGYRTLGRLDDAAAVYREQIKVAPNNSSAYFLLGMILRQKGSLPEARAAFTKAQELQPDDLLSTHQLVELDIHDKDFAAAHQRVGMHLQKHPGLAGAHFLEGKVCAAQRDWDRAEAAFLKSIELNPAAVNVYNELIGTYIAAGKLQEACASLEAHLAKNPDDPRALIASAMIHEALNEFLKARVFYEKILAKNPDALVALNNLANIYVQRLDQPDKGYELARKARTLNSTDPAIADTLGWSLYKRRDYPQALALFTEAASKLADLPEVQFHLGMAAYMMGQSEVARTALKLAAAAGADFPGKSDMQARLALLESGDAALSAIDLEAALQKHPDDILRLMRLAEVYAQQGDNDKAVAACEKALKLNPKLIAAVIKLAQLHAGPLKSPGKAREFATKARELAPNDPRVAGILGAMTYQAGDYPKAYSLLQESASGLPHDPGTLHDLAWAAYSQGKVDEARRSMQQVLKAAPASPQLADATSFLELTALDQGTKDLAASLPKIESVLQQNPNHVPALMARAALHVERGEATPAAAIYAKVLATFPDFAPAQKWLAALYASEPGNLQKGYDLAVKARATLTEDPDLAHILGGLAYQRNEFSYAAQLFNECSKKRPLNSMDLYYSGMSLLATKEMSEGKAALQRALAAGLPEPLASDVKQVIENSQAPGK
ncbi:MAG: tetratricopeptide repeat protein [Verrucomicrobiota bacterium]